MKFDNVLAELNGFGRFQLMTILLLVIPRMTLPFQFLLNNFIADIPSHHCDVSSLDDGGVFGNLSQAERLIVGIPVQEDGTPSSCEMFAEPQYHLLLNSSNITELPAVPCQSGWKYDNTTFKSTLATEWDLVCDKRRVNRATATIFFMGVMLGAAVFGYLSDRFGRKTTLLVSYVMVSVFGFTSAFSYNFTMFAVMRFFTGVGMSGISIITIVLGIEWVDIKHRTTVGVLISMDWSVFAALLPLIAYFLNDWRSLTAAVTSPMFLAIITWWLPDSARWLISNGKVKRAHFYLSRSGVAFTYYGISLNVSGFGVNIYVTQFIYGAIEIPAKACMLVTLDKIGRRLTQSGTLVLTGLCILCNIFIPTEPQYHLLLNSSNITELPTVPCQSGWMYDNTTFKSTLATEAEFILDCQLVNVRREDYFQFHTMKFENILADINGFGRFQIMIIVISFIGRFTMPCHFMLNNFIAAVPSHHCDVSSLDDGGVFRNLTEAQRLAVSIPEQEDGTPNSCQMFAEPQYHLLLNSSSTAELLTVPCRTGWVYDNTTFKSTITSQWDLVCDKRGKNKATATIFFVGVMFGAMSFGSLSDRFGRRIMLLASYVSGMVFALASAFSTTYVMFAVLRFFTGFCITGIVIVSTVLSLEWVDIEHRKLVGVIDSLSWTFGNAIYAAIAYFVTDWRLLIISVTSPLILAIISWRWMPESARWLIANGKLMQAQMYLKKCAKMNRTEESTEALKTETLSTIVVTEKRDRAYSYLDLIRTPRMRKLALRTGLLWFCIATTFYGISFNISGFGLNLYLTQFTYAVIEVPAKLSVYFLLDRVGRRPTEVGTLLMAAVCLAINIVIPKDTSVARTVVAIVGKGFSSASFATLVLYSSELYPTVVRQNGMGYNSFMARLGVAVAPLILLLDEVWKDLPQLVLCFAAVLGVIVARTLPETRARCLPETIEDIEEQRQ
ncbi:solute carrier family 22 member 7-like [Chaetodon trifascialis]|uniref:solute carrier family 22 member 7-like n=1 Tax=Chaetodon trifascialis TaxID=109706 RepID=UPI003992FF6A